MSDNKSYYYMRLKENFFEDDAIKILEGIPEEGYKYSNILLKLYLRSLKTEGRLMVNNAIPYNATMIAAITNHDVSTCKCALEAFEQLGLIEILDNGAIYMMNIQSLVGRSSTEADRKREYRAKIDGEKHELGQMSDKCPTLSDKRPPEIEIEIDKDINNILCAKNESLHDAKELFEKVWKLYPNKKGKGQVSDAAKKRLLKVGYDQLERCINRYLDELKKDKWRKQQNGSTFFNSGYVDYLDENYNNSKQDAYDFDFY